MEDQFLSVAARRKRLPQSMRMSSPLIGMPAHGGGWVACQVLGLFR